MRALVGGVQGGQHLRGDQGGRDALDEAGADQLAGALRERAEQAGEREHEEADDEQPLAAEAVAARAGGGDQAGVDDAVGGDDELQDGGGGAQVVADGAQSDVDREERHDRHHHRGQGGGEAEGVHATRLAALVGGRAARGQGGTGNGGVKAHAAQPAAAPILVVRAW